MKVAAIDIGSNSIHMIIAADNGDGSFEVLDREKDVVRLGAGAFKQGRISDTAFAAGLDALSKFKQIIDRHGVDDTVAVATSAVREAENGRQFIDAARKLTGIQPRVITGREEARLIHYAVRAALDLRHRKALMIDIGGGSVEVAVAGYARLRIVHSLKLGVLRLRDEIGREDLMAAGARERLSEIIRAEARDAMNEVREVGFDVAVGTSGTILNLGVAVHLKKGQANWISPHGRMVTLLELRALAIELSGLDAERRARVPGIDPDRGDTVQLGAWVVCQLLEMAGAESLMLCDAAIREGLVYERLGRAGDVSRQNNELPNLRRASVLRLARKCGQDNPHPRQIVKLALQIFDQTTTVHGLNNSARELLEYAAWLHDAGRAIGFERHEQLSYYIIRYGELRGFTDEEIELIALIARFHRRAKPKPRFDEFAHLSPWGQQVVTLGAAILRLAEGLDRRHLQVVRKLRCELWTRRMRIYVDAAGDAAVESWSARRKVALLAKVLERKIDVESEGGRVKSHPSA